MSDKELIYVDIKNLQAKKKIIDTKYDELVSMFHNYQKMIDETEKIYDTESAKYFRKVVDEYMKLSLVKVNNDFKLYIDKLDDIIKIYDEHEKEVNKLVNTKGDDSL